MTKVIGNRYEITQHIGKGGMADVYLAYDTILKREVAVKILKQDLVDDPVQIQRFEREAGSTTKLVHPNIVDVYDVGEDNNEHYIVMEYIHGYTLKQLIRRRGAIPYKESVWIIKQLAGALMEAHRNNIIHRDIKSQNVLIKPDGTIKLSDFGIAIANGDIEITSKDSVIGSVHYLAPELSKGAQATMQSDIYSLGIVFYELLTGDVPFKGDNAVQVALKHVRETIPSVRKINPEIPESVEQIVMKATAKNLKNRYRNIAYMIRDLNQCLKKQPENNKKESVLDETSTINLPKKKKINKVLITLISILAIGILAGVLLLSGLIRVKPKVHIVPNLVGLTIQQAEDVLGNDGIEIDKTRIIYVTTDDIEKDKIVSTSPSFNEEIENGEKIKITVSDGVYIVVDNYIGYDYKLAQSLLENLNFIVRLEPVVSDKDIGYVIEQSLKEGEKVSPNTKNTITLKYAVKEVKILDLSYKGKKLSEIEDYFKENNFLYEFKEMPMSEFNFSDVYDVESDCVVITSPALGMPYTQDEDNKIIVYYYHEVEKGENE